MLVENHEVIIINSMRCAGYLMFYGCRLIRTEPHKSFPNRNVFIFNDDAKTKTYLRKYTDEECKRDDAKEIHSRDNRTRVQGMA